MKRNLKRYFCSWLALAATVLLISCGGLSESDTDEALPSSNGKTYLSVKIGSVTSSRSIKPDSDFTVSALKDIKLTGTLGTETSTLIDAESAAGIPASIEILPGSWAFTLTAKLNGCTFTGTKEAVIQSGLSNSVSFTLSPSEHFGGYEISFILSNAVTKATAEVKDAATDTLAGTVTASIEANGAAGRKAVFSQSVSDEAERLASGVYSIEFSFFGGTDGDVLLNKVEYYVYISDAKTTTAEIALDLNQIYTISYQDEDGNVLSAADFTGGVMVTQYSVRSGFTLPEFKTEGKVFFGWKTDESPALFTEITEKISGDKTFTAVFYDPVIYVSATGDDTANSGLKVTEPVKTIQGACEKIIEYGRSDLDWTIKVNGEVTGIPTGASGINATYGQSEIPETLTTDHAASILLTGATGLDDYDIPQASINRGLYTSSAASDGTALKISTQVPVTIMNLKITGGNNTKGGGLFIAQNARVSLASGSLVIQNRTGSNGRGGGVHNEGILFMYGTAVIGDKSKNIFPVDSSGTSDSTKHANYASTGGGLFNGIDTDSSKTSTAKFYMGYKSETEKEELTGGFYYNAGNGGALYNSYGGTVYIASGNFCFNASAQNGGAIYNQNNASIEMSGGLIENNRCTSSSDVHGGGVYNAYKNSRFVMSGGRINKNYAKSSNTAASSSWGGGVYNGGKMFMYGTAVIGDETKETAPSAENAVYDSETATSSLNIAEWGSAICNYRNTSSNIDAELYLGYKSEMEKAELNGGIFYNYAKNTGTRLAQGGAICNSGLVKIDSGTIAYNVSENFGGAVYMATNLGFEMTGGTIKENTAAVSGGAFYLSSTKTLMLSGTVSIPAGAESKNDIFLDTTYSQIKIGGALAPDFATTVSLGTYDNSKAILALEEGVTDTSIESECSKFTVTAETTEVGTRTWTVGSDGKLTTDDVLASGRIYSAQDLTFAYSCATELRKGVNKTISLSPVIKFKDTSLNYSSSDKKIHTGSSPSNPAISDETVTWDLSLYYGTEPVSGATSDTNSIELTLPYEGKYTLHIKAIYCGITYDTEIVLTCKKS